MFEKYKISRTNNKNKVKYNNIENINNNYANTISSINNQVNNNILNSSYMNTIGNFSNKLSREEKYNMLLFSEDKNILYSDFIKIVLDNHIRLRDKQLKTFVELFRSIDTNRDGIINEEEFTQLVMKMKIFKEDEVETKIFEFLEKFDPFDTQKFTFSDCVSFFSSELFKENDENGKGISILEKVCLNGNIKNENNELNNNEIIENKSDQIMDSGIEQNNDVNNNDINNNNDIHKNK